MGQNDDYPIDRVPFPEGYEHFAGLARFAAMQLRELDDRIKAIPTEDIKTTLAKYELHPKLSAKSIDQWRNRDNRNSLEAQRENIETELNKRIDRDIETWEIDIDTARQIKLATIDTLHPSQFSDMSGEQLIKHKAAVKDEHNSQSYMRSLLRASRAEPKQVHETADLEKPKDKALNVDEISFSQRYTLDVKFGSKTSKSEVDRKFKSKEIDKD